MSDKPDFIDNLDGNTMANALRQLLGPNTGETPVVAEDGAKLMKPALPLLISAPVGLAVLRRPLKISP